MPPKEKVPAESKKKTISQSVRPAISNSSLVYVPEDALEGYEERLERCIDWTIFGAAIRYHKEMCLRDNIPEISFGQALQTKLNKSVLKGFLDDDSSISLQQHWEILLPMTLWDQKRSDDQQAKIVFASANNITDNMHKLIQKTAKTNDRETLRRGLKASEVLRVNNCDMTYLDKTLLDYPHLTTLSLCGNYISELDCTFLPKCLRALEMQTNRVSSLDSFADLPPDLLYLGLANNFLTSDKAWGIQYLPNHITVLDLADNDIYDLEPILRPLEHLSNLDSLLLYGNPCACCMGYAMTVISRLNRLKWLDNRKILAMDKERVTAYEPHPDDLRSTWFTFSILRIMSPPMPPKPEKGQVATFFIELELPLLDSIRRNFLMFRQYESLIQILPFGEDDDVVDAPEEASKQNTSSTDKDSKPATFNDEASSESTDIFLKLAPRNSYVIHHFITFESNRVSWSKMLTFADPTVRIFCPDLNAIRNTLRSNITLRLMYSMVVANKKPDKKNVTNFDAYYIPEQFLTIATIKCPLRKSDWSQPFQHFHWDDTLGTDEAIHWGDGDLSVLQYMQTVTRTTKGKPDAKDTSEKVVFPDNLTCHFSFSIDMLGF